MYIEPNTSIIILKNCPLDTTYEHTIYFESKSSQAEYFKGLKKYTLERNTYQRVKRGYMRVNIQAENLYDCNYLMFQNTAFGNKWFYAFIESVEYINNAVSEIEFKIDVMQTWFFDYKLQECFVEREHISVDNIGANTVPENLETGEYIIHYHQNAGVSDHLVFIADATINKEYEDYYGGYDNGGSDTSKELMTGLANISFEKASSLSQWLNGGGEFDEEKLKKIKDGVKNVRIGVGEENRLLYDGGLMVRYGGSLDKIGNYVPRNKKLLTYPYNFIYVTNYSGNSCVYQFELFGESVPFFYLKMTSIDNAPCVLTPRNYKGVTNNYDERITLSKFPTISWRSSVYADWLVQAKTNAIPRLIHTVSNGIVQGTFTGSVGRGTAMSGVSTVASMLAEHKLADLQPPQANGCDNGYTDYLLGTIDFCIMNKGIKPEYCRIIDDYFDRYGYATHRNKIPNRNVRPHWCYTKTVGCTVKGSIPCDDMKTICSIYDKGITFWKDGNNIGNYNLDNRI